MEEKKLYDGEYRLMNLVNDVKHLFLVVGFLNVERRK